MNEEITEFKKELLSKDDDEEEYLVTCRYKDRKLNSNIFISKKEFSEVSDVDDFLKSICLDIARENYEIESGVVFSPSDKPMGSGLSKIMDYWKAQ